MYKMVKKVKIKGVEYDVEDYHLAFFLMLQEIKEALERIATK